MTKDSEKLSAWASLLAAVAPIVTAWFDRRTLLQRVVELEGEVGRLREKVDDLEKKGRLARWLGR